MSKIPYIGEVNGIKTLFVDDRPFFVRGGELHNSSSSDLEYMDEKVWPMLKGLNMNTVVLPVAWENIEPAEGSFDFSLVDGLIDQARREGMKLVILWFGLWKNSESNYVPMWVKRDYETYWRVENAKGVKQNIISPFCKAAVEKDAFAYGKLLEHLKAVDSEDNTVIFLQVENEIGVLHSERDFSAGAEILFQAAVPEDIKMLFDGDERFPANMDGQSWAEVFGENACEMFMCWGYANAVETIVQAGQSQYNLPMYANAWLEQHPWRPGTYPCGGPVAKMHKIWKHCAPSLFTVGPDIYVPYTADVMDEYTALDNPLFVPEVRKDPGAVGYLLYAFGHNNAIGVSPFGVEDINADPATLKKPPFFVMMALNIDPAAMDCSATAPYLSAVYSFIREMEPLLLEYRGTSHMKSFVRHNAVDDGIMLSFEKYDIVVNYGRTEDKKPVASGIIYELAPDRFLMTGMNYSFTIYPKMGDRSEVVIGEAREGRLEAGRFVSGRILNGDERMDIKLDDMPGAVSVEVYTI